MQDINGRILFIDLARGFCLLWIIWYHSLGHPLFLDYPIAIPSLFLISGMVFKNYSWRKFISKKIIQYIIPFAFFYLLYYVFLLVINYISFHTIDNQILFSVFGLFLKYKETDAFIVNYPLWYILALLWLQLMLKGLLVISSNWKWLLSASFIISFIGCLYLTHIFTYFQFGRATQYMLCFCIGYLLFEEKIILRAMSLTKVMFISILFIMCFCVAALLNNNYLSSNFPILEYCIVGIIVVLLFSKISINKVLLWIGRNSLVILALHDIFLSICNTILFKTGVEPGIIYSLVSTIIVLLISIPCVIIFSKYFPFFIGKTKSSK